MHYGVYEEKFKSLVDTYLKDNGLEGLDGLEISKFEITSTAVQIEGVIAKLDLYFVCTLLSIAETEWLFAYKKLGSIRRTYTREFSDNLEVITTPKLIKFYYDNGGDGISKEGQTQ